MPGTKFNQIKDKDPNIETYLAKVSKAESGDNPNARNPYGSATGLFQFTEGTWKGMTKKYNLDYTLEDRKNPEKAAQVMRLFTQENENQLKPIVGRELTDGDRYLAHFLGSGGAKKFFTVYSANPNAPISTVLSSDALAANKGVAYNKDGSLKTVSDVYDWANTKMNIKVKPKIYNSQGTSETDAFDVVSNIPTSSVPLESSTTEYTPPVETKENQEVVQAKKEINEKSFVEELGNILSQTQQQQVVEQQPEIEIDPSAYNYINIEEY